MIEDVRQPDGVRDEASPATASRSLAQPGKYSIERMLALEEYSRTKTLSHVLAVLLLAPLPSLIIVIAYELPPLQPIEAGWEANWVFFVVRLGIGMMIVSEGGMVLARHLMPELKAVLRLPTRLAIDVASGIVYATTGLIFAHVWGFPVPFTTLLGNPTVGGTLLVGIFVVSRHLIKSNRDLRRHLLRYVCFIRTVPVMATVYPAYLVLFLSVHRSYQPLVMLLVPVIKILFRKLISRITAEWEDDVPAMVIFSIELFNSLYLIICLQSGGSIATTAAVMAIDLAHTVRSQWRLHYSTTKLQKVMAINHDETLLVRVWALCEDTAGLQAALRLHSQALKQSVSTAHAATRGCRSTAA